MLMSICGIGLYNKFKLAENKAKMAAQYDTLPTHRSASKSIMASGYGGLSRSTFPTSPGYSAKQQQQQQQQQQQFATIAERSAMQNI